MSTSESLVAPCMGFTWFTHTIATIVKRPWLIRNHQLFVMYFVVLYCGSTIASVTHMKLIYIWGFSSHRQPRKMVAFYKWLIFDDLGVPQFWEITVYIYHMITVPATLARTGSRRVHQCVYTPSISKHFQKEPLQFFTCESWLWIISGYSNRIAQPRHCLTDETWWPNFPHQQPLLVQ